MNLIIFFKEFIEMLWRAISVLSILYVVSTITDKVPIIFGIVGVLYVGFKLIDIWNVLFKKRTLNGSKTHLMEE